jgi:hypothetical protein
MSSIAALHARALFHARCKALEDIAYGLETDRREYLDNGLAAARLALR